MAQRPSAVHETAATGFGNEAEAYERARPSYPPDAVAWLADTVGLGTGMRAVDLAAGTGKLTRLLVPSGAELLAVEPVHGMRDQLVLAVPGVTALAGTAEALPFADATLDAITVAQAFHWFDPERAPAELHRVLRPGGRIGVIWNHRDRGVPWVDAVWSIMDDVGHPAPWRSEPDQRRSATSLAAPRFGPLHHAQFHHEHVVSPAAMVDRIRSVSHVAALPPTERDEVLGRVRALLADDPATAGRDELAVPYVVDVYWAERLG